MTNAFGPNLYLVPGEAEKHEALDVVLELFLAQYDTQSTRRVYEAEVRRIFHWLGHEQVRLVTTADLLRHRATKSSLAPATRHRILVTVRRFFSFAAKHGLIDEDPARDLVLPTVHAKEPEILSQAEAELMLRIPDRRTTKGRRDLVILALGLCNGLRVGEICAINLGDRRERYGRPALLVRGKGSKQRTLILSSVEQEAIENYLKVRNGPTDTGAPLLLTVKGGRHRITRKVVAGVLRSTQAKALLTNKRITPHILRHSAFSLELHAGADIKKISAQAGHSSLAVTARYIHQLDAGRDPAVDANPLSRKR